MKIINMWFNRPTTGRNYSDEQKFNFESHVPFSKCLRAKIHSNINVYFDPQGCQTLPLKKSEPLLFPLGCWTIKKWPQCKNQRGLGVSDIPYLRADTSSAL